MKIGANVAGAAVLIWGVAALASPARAADRPATIAGATRSATTTTAARAS